MSTKESTVFIRDNDKDKGQVPTSGVVWLSPDIILWHQKLSQEKAQSKFGTEESYKDNPGLNLYPSSLENYVIIRMKNTAPADETVKVQLWQVPAGMLNYPGTWDASNLVFSEEVTAVGTAKTANGVTVTRSIQLKKFDEKGPGHHCFIAEIIPTGKHPLVPKKSRKWWDWTEVLKEHNTLAQHNYFLVAPDLKTCSNSTYTISNTRTEKPTGFNSEIWLIGKKLPIGCKVEIWTPKIADPSTNGHLDNRSNPFIVGENKKVQVLPMKMPAAPAEDKVWSTPITVQWTYPDGVVSKPGDRLGIQEYYMGTLGEKRELKKENIQPGEIYLVGCAHVGVAEHKQIRA